MPLDVLAAGYPGMDRIMRVNRAPKSGETAIILEDPQLEEATIGGCPSNIAVACARLGLKAGVVIVLGEDAEGLRYREALASEGVYTQAGVNVVSGGRTPRTFLYIGPDGRHQTFFDPGVSARQDIELQLEDSLARGARWGVITVGNAGHNRVVTEWLLRHGVPILWSLKNDAQSYPLSLVERLVEVCKILIMNDDEAHSLQAILNLRSIEALLERGPDTLILTLGAQGSRIIQRNRTQTVPAVQPRRVVDPTGAGDAFTAGVLFGLCNNLALELAARVGAVMASFVLEAWGCQVSLPDRGRVFERYRDAFGEDLVLELPRQR